ncbi:hypothetical protein [Streptomyces sp. NPDC047061]|uniref:hypothetical protein n=1 Tax=Streptomyces sp. NPDC047061 TaxID=3154605 RepID=UPI0033F19FD2
MSTGQDTRVYEASGTGAYEVPRARFTAQAAEFAALLHDHHSAEARTLTTGAEANLLKPAGPRGTLAAEQALHWDELKAACIRTQILGGPDGDPLTRAVFVLGLLTAPDARRVAGREEGA